MNRVVRRLVAVLAASAVLLTGCIGLPESGPVVEANLAGERDGDSASSIDPRSPRPGDSRLEIVNGFLEAMMAWPISTSVAKQYLTSDSAEEWSPESTVIYTDLAAPREDGSTVRIRMRDAAALDASGAWRGALSGGSEILRFRLTVEDGEFRILRPVDALVVRTSWFQQRYQQVSLYFFDPTAQVLVPEPVFVPQGETFATDLVTALLAGPPPGLEGVVTTFLPQRLGVGFSVPVEDGVAKVDLQGEAPSTSAAERELMLAQLAATLGQEPGITALKVTIGGDEIDVPGAATEYPVSSADAFDPADTGSAGVLYGLRRGRLVVGGSAELKPVSGPLGRRQSEPIASFSVAPGGNRVAAVLEDRRRAIVAALRAPVEGDRRRRVVVRDGSDLARPTWDAVGRLWLLDRTPRGARVLLADRGEIREVRVAGVTGTPTRRILVSRDGTRLVALVEDGGRERLVATRIAVDATGRVTRTTRATVIWSAGDASALDVAWTEAVQVAVLTTARPAALYEVETVAVDGATVGVDTLSSMVSGRVIGLAGEPWPATALYAVARGALIDVRTGERIETDAQVSGLDYSG